MIMFFLDQGSIKLIINQLYEFASQYVLWEWDMPGSFLVLREHTLKSLGPRTRQFTERECGIPWI